MRKTIAALTAAGLLIGATAALAAEKPIASPGTSSISPGGKSPGLQMQQQPNSSGGGDYVPSYQSKGAANDTPGSATTGAQTKPLSSNPMPSKGSTSSVGGG